MYQNNFQILILPLELSSGINIPPDDQVIYLFCNPKEMCRVLLHQFGLQVEIMLKEEWFLKYILYPFAKSKICEFCEDGVTRKVKII